MKPHSICSFLFFFKSITHVFELSTDFSNLRQQFNLIRIDPLRSITLHELLLPVLSL